MQHDMLARRVQEIAPEVIQWRHQIHQNPELSFHETATSALIEQKLRSFGIDEIRRIGASGTGVFATLRGTGKGPDLCLGIRADIDALPIQEQSGVPFASKNPGVFHGCGHDTHTAALLGTAGDLVESKFKRWVGVKDSSAMKMTNGLGGILDMIDSLLIAPPVLLAFL